MTRKEKPLMLKCVAVVCVFLMALMTMNVAGCGSTTQTVQKALVFFQTGKSYVAAAQDMATELQSLNPDLAKEVAEYAQLAGDNLNTLITIANNYLKQPDASGYQALLNGVDALAASIDAKVLSSAKVTNSASQTKALKILSASAGIAHVVAALLQAHATPAQVQAMPVIAGRVKFEDVRPFLDRRAIESDIVAAGIPMAYAEKGLAAAGL